MTPSVQWSRHISGIKKLLLLLYRKNKIALVALLVVIVINLTAVMAPLIAPFPAGAIAVGPSFLPPFTDPNHLLGTDDLGRDILSETIWGSQVSLLVAYSVVLFTTVIGVLVGSVAGYFGGNVDEALSRLTEFFFIIPTLILALILVSIYRPNIYLIILAISVTTWTTTARLVRAEFLSLRERGFVEAAKAIGASTLAIMYKEILPNSVAPIMVNATIMLARAIILEAFLGFFGLSDPNLVSWGRILCRGNPHFLIAWWTVTWAGVALSVTVLSLNMVGQTVNDIVSARLRRESW